MQLHLFLLFVPLPNRTRPDIVSVIILSPCRRHVLPEGDIDSPLDGWGSDPVRRALRNRVEPIRLSLSAATSSTT
jgi:hypothetical protein